LQLPPAELLIWETKNLMNKFGRKKEVGGNSAGEKKKAKLGGNRVLAEKLRRKVNIGGEGTGRALPVQKGI